MSPILNLTHDNPQEDRQISLLLVFKLVYPGYPRINPPSFNCDEER